MAAVAADSTICHAVRFTSNASIVWVEADALSLGCRSDRGSYELVAILSAFTTGGETASQDRMRMERMEI
jgi:hypothetical protein